MRYHIDSTYEQSLLAALNNCPTTPDKLEIALLYLNGVLAFARFTEFNTAAPEIGEILARCRAIKEAFRDPPPHYGDMAGDSRATIRIVMGDLERRIIAYRDAPSR